MKKARHLREYVVEFTFTDGSVREIDLEPFLWGPIFERVRNPNYFSKFRIDKEGGTIGWPNGADIDPDVLYLGLKPAAREAPSQSSISRQADSGQRAFRTPRTASEPTDYRVKKAKHLRDFIVEFTFTDGTRREIDLEPFLHGGIFDELRSMDAFRAFKVKYGTIAWPNGADIAPETLYYDLGVPEEETQVSVGQE